MTMLVLFGGVKVNTDIDAGLKTRGFRQELWWRNYNVKELWPDLLDIKMATKVKCTLQGLSCNWYNIKGFVIP